MYPLSYSVSISISISIYISLRIIYLEEEMQIFFFLSIQQTGANYKRSKEGFLHFQYHLLKYQLILVVGMGSSPSKVFFRKRLIFWIVLYGMVSGLEMDIYLSTTTTIIIWLTYWRYRSPCPRHEIGNTNKRFLVLNIQFREFYIHQMIYETDRGVRRESDLS